MATQSPTPLSKANTTFCLALFNKFCNEAKTNNVFCSPLSISSALSMVLLGTRGNTATQMSEVLCFTEPEPKPVEVQQCMQQQQQQQQQQCIQQQSLSAPQCLNTRDFQDELHASFGQLLRELNKKNASYKLSVANRLYGEQTYDFLEDYLLDTEKYYNAGLETVDFRNKSEEARVNINTWVEKQTQDKIKDLLGKDVVDSSTTMVLVNAIYFKGKWYKSFKETSTRDLPFRINKNETKMVKMMYQKSKFPLTYIPEADCQILEMPYVEKELSMLILLPNLQEDGTADLGRVEKLLTYDNFVEWTRPDMMNEVELDVGLPRFKFEEKYDLKSVLKSMGMVDAFDGGLSDFSGMSGANDLVMSEVIHKAFVEVNEEGTEAAAATAVVMTLRCAQFPRKFIADHPFLFFIRHNASMSILFAGKYCSPE